MQKFNAKKVNTYVNQNKRPVFVYQLPASAKESLDKTGQVYREDENGNILIFSVQDKGATAGFIVNPDTGKAYFDNTSEIELKSKMSEIDRLTEGLSPDARAIFIREMAQQILNTPASHSSAPVSVPQEQKAEEEAGDEF